MNFLGKIIYLGVNGKSDLDNNLKIINVITMIGSTVVIIYVSLFGFLSIYVSSEYQKVFYAVLIDIPLYFSVFYFTSHRQKRLAGIALIIAGLYSSMGVSILVFGASIGLYQFVIAFPPLVLLIFSARDDFWEFIFFSIVCGIFFLYGIYELKDPLIGIFPVSFPHFYLHFINSVGTILLITISVFIFSRDLNEARDMIKEEHKRANELLLNILPEAIAERLKGENKTIADGFVTSSILFADIVGFTKMASQFKPDELVEILNKYFSHFDELTEKYSLEKIKTIGDSYMVASGIPNPSDDHAINIANFALEMISSVEKMSGSSKMPISLRIGINSGPVTAGVIGTKKFIYDLWGDAVNMAARMESHGIPGKIQVTEESYNLLKDFYNFENRGKIEIKGKGKVSVYILTGPRESFVKNIA